jgi:hypothetical protein
MILYLKLKTKHDKRPAGKEREKYRAALVAGKYSYSDGTIQYFI